MKNILSIVLSAVAVLLATIALVVAAHAGGPTSTSPQARQDSAQRTHTTQRPGGDDSRRGASDSADEAIATDEAAPGEGRPSDDRRAPRPGRGPLAGQDPPAVPTTPGTGESVAPQAATPTS